MLRRSVGTLFITACGLMTPSLSSADGDPGFAALMGTLQVYLHKLDLSVQHDNAELAGFYVHELEEAVETIGTEIDSYDGYPVGQLTTGTMIAPIEALEAAMASGQGTDQAMNGLVNACNACHAATDHGFIEITRAHSNPFNQSFESE